MIYAIAILHDPAFDPPKEDGDYGTVSNIGLVDTLHYSKKHNAFNTYHHTDAKNKIKVKYWFDIPKVLETEGKC